MAKGKKQCAVKKRITLKKVVVTGYTAIDKPSTTFNPEGTYVLTVLMDSKEAKKLQKEIKEMIKKQEADYGGMLQDFTRISIPYVRVIKDKDTGKITEKIEDPEGRAGFRLDTRAYIKDGKPGKVIGIFDAKGKPVKGINPNQGSVINAVVDLEGYTAVGKTGISVKLAGIQIIKLEEFNGAPSFDKLGFSEEDGYIMDDEFVDCDSEVADEEEEEL